MSRLARIIAGTSLVVALAFTSGCGGGKEPSNTNVNDQPVMSETAQPTPDPVAPVEEVQCGTAESVWQMPTTTDNACTYVLEAALLLTNSAGSVGLTTVPDVKVHIIGIDEEEQCDDELIIGTDTKPVRWCQNEQQLLVVDQPASELLQMDAADVLFAQVMDAYGLQVAMQGDEELRNDDRAWYAGATMVGLVDKGVLTEDEVIAIEANIYITDEMQKAFSEGYYDIH